MNPLKKAFVFMIVAVMLVGLLPTLQTTTSAAATPIISLNSTTAVNPIVDHLLSSTDFASGGPHTVTFEWRAVNIRDNDVTDPGAGHAFVGITGTPYGSASGDNPTTGKPAGIKGTTNWAKVTMTFGNVGVYNVSGSNIPGNVLRFGMWKAKGELQIKNLQIKTGSTVKYDLNTDAIVAQVVANTQANGMTEADLGELAAIDFENCPWTAGQFSTGNYTAYVKFETGAAPTTTTEATRPTRSSTTTKATTKATTTKATTVPTTRATTKPTTAPTTRATTKPTTAPASKPTATEHNCNLQGHKYSGGQCKFCGLSDPNYDVCLNEGHKWVDGYCDICGILDPNYSPSTKPTTAPRPITTAPSTALPTTVRPSFIYPDPTIMTTAPSDPCYYGHTFNNGCCIYCYAIDPNFYPPYTAIPSTAVSQPTMQPQPNYPGPGNNANDSNNNGWEDNGNIPGNNNGIGGELGDDDDDDDRSSSSSRRKRRAASKKDDTMTIALAVAGIGVVIIAASVAIWFVLKKKR